jgi:hypothetical protein
LFPKKTIITTNSIIFLLQVRGREHRSAEEGERSVLKDSSLLLPLGSQLEHRTQLRAQREEK